MRILVTGASGFVGTPLCLALRQAGDDVVAAVRSADRLPAVARAALDLCEIGAIDGGSDWAPALAACEAVVHLAARVHLMRDDAADPLAEFRRVNTEGTLNLARQAADAGVRRFVFVSSIKVNGEGGGQAYRETDPVGPTDPYARSKWEAEQGLASIAAETGMEVVILRPPLIYGPGVGANFLRLMQAVERGWPLPLGLAANRRSLLYVGNLVAAIQACLRDPRAANRTYLLADDPALSSAELVRVIARALAVPARLVPVPVWLLTGAAALLGKRAAMQRLLGSLEIDSSRIRAELDWQAPYSMDAGMQAAADWLRRR